MSKEKNDDPYIKVWCSKCETQGMVRASQDGQRVHEGCGGVYAAEHYPPRKQRQKIERREMINDGIFIFLFFIAACVASWFVVQYLIR